MTEPEIREVIVIAGGMLIVLAGLLLLIVRSRTVLAESGRAPLSEQWRDVRDRVVNVEQQVQALSDWMLRLRELEQISVTVRHELAALREGQKGLQHMLTILVEHQIQGRK